MKRKKRHNRLTELTQERSKWLHDLKRLEKKRHKLKLIRNPENSASNISTKYSSRPLTLMAQKSSAHFVSDSVIAGRFAAPKVFSIHDNPQETLIYLCKIAKYAKARKKYTHIHLDLNKVEKMDLAADSLLAIVLKEIKNECFKVKTSRIHGTYPKSIELRREMDKIGTVKVLKSEPGKDNIRLENASDSSPVFRHRESAIGMTRSIETSEPVEIVTTKFVDHVNHCLSTIKLELTEQGRGNLCGYVGEVLANAQEHAKMTDWTLVGYLDIDARVFKAAIINFGLSYEDTFLSLDRENSYAWDQVKDYVSRHQKTGISLGALLTAAALQEKISSKNESKDHTRGQGTVAMISFFQRISELCNGIGQGKAEMSLITGSTHIVFNGAYKINTDSRTGRQVIAFNKENNLQKAPDSSVVKTMTGVVFPGTIISINFPLVNEMELREIQS